MTQHLDPERLYVHHVGGRLSNIDGQGFPLPLAKPFLPDVDVYLYEADANCIEQIYNVNQHLPVKLEVINGAVAAASGRTKFHLCHDRYGSSLIPLNPRYRTLYSLANAYGDFTCWDSGRTVEEIEIDAVSIDDLRRRRGFLVDFLSTDAEGADFDLLQGARETLKEHSIGFYCEAQLIEYRKPSRHFGHIIDFADSIGYRLVRYDNHGDLFYYRGPIGARGQGSNIFGDALFLKEIDDVLGRPEPGRQLRKLAFVAFCFGQVEYAMESLKALAGLPGEATVPSDLVYRTFLDRAAETHRSMPALYPPRYVDCYSVADAKAFNAPDVTAPLPPHSVHAVRERYFSYTDRAGFLAAVQALSGAVHTSFEQLLLDHEMAPLARLVRERRIAALGRTLRTLGYAKDVGGQLHLDVDALQASLGEFIGKAT
ncbi:MAG: FkbM family methyltransferase [Proteobacteria bacterium]|nr:FkbM family methyltransferase [Pseudomonadota bacterium]MBI3497183.1 FkbM family methyltransferase [Pseudomonadota bacterium]